MKLGATKNYLNANDVNIGDTIVFLDEGEYVPTEFKHKDGNPKKNLEFKIEHGGEEKIFNLNIENKNLLIAAWGNDTTKWIDKVAEVTGIAEYRQLKDKDGKPRKGIVLGLTKFDREK